MAPPYLYVTILISFYFQIRPTVTLHVSSKMQMENFFILHTDYYDIFILLHDDYTYYLIYKTFDLDSTYTY